MLTGVKFPAQLNDNLKLTLSQWMGCQRAIWNAKVQEDVYYRGFCRKFFPKEYAYGLHDQTYSQYKDKELTPWFFDVPSQILRNAATRYYQTYINFLRGVCGRPRFHAKRDKASVYITSELFRFIKHPASGETCIEIGTKAKPVGLLKFSAHRDYEFPRSITVSKRRGRWSVSFNYTDPLIDDNALLSLEQQLEQLRSLDANDLAKLTVGLDRGVAITCATNDKSLGDNGNFSYSDKQMQRFKQLQVKLERLQRKLSRQIKGSNRYNKTKFRLSKVHEQITNIRIEFAHQISRQIVDSDNQVFILEDLKTKNMTKKPKPKRCEKTGKFLYNGASRKAGLNKAILHAGWFRIGQFISYKAAKVNKAVFKVPTHHTSQECACCGHTHPDNRQTQQSFVCLNCGHAENADTNAAKVIAKRAVKLIKDTGTVLDGNLLTTEAALAKKGKRRKSSLAKPSTGRSKEHGGDIRRLEPCEGRNPTGKDTLCQQPLTQEPSKKTKSDDLGSHAL